MTGNFSVLIADDNDINRWILREQLETWTTNIEEASDGQQAWQKLQSRVFDMVFLDMSMPCLTGLEIISRLRSETGPSQMTPAIAITAHTQQQQRQLAIAAGFDDYLTKPIRLAHLREAVENWIAIEDSQAHIYADRLLRKTENNIQLSNTLLDKLFSELPWQTHEIERHIALREWQLAKDVVHKMHGSFCFLDFPDCQLAVEQLEQAISESEASKITECAAKLQRQLEVVQSNKSAIYQCLAEKQLSEEQTKPAPHITE